MNTTKLRSCRACSKKSRRNVEAFHEQDGFDPARRVAVLRASQRTKVRGVRRWVLRHLIATTQVAVEVTDTQGEPLSSLHFDPLNLKVSMRAAARQARNLFRASN